MPYIYIFSCVMQRRRGGRELLCTWNLTVPLSHAAVDTQHYTLNLIQIVYRFLIWTD